MAVRVPAARVLLWCVGTITLVSGDGLTLLGTYGIQLPDPLGGPQEASTEAFRVVAGAAEPIGRLPNDLRSEPVAVGRHCGKRWRRHGRAVDGALTRTVDAQVKLAPGNCGRAAHRHSRP